MEPIPKKYRQSKLFPLVIFQKIKNIVLSNVCPSPYVIPLIVFPPSCQVP